MQITISGEEWARAMQYAHAVELEVKIAQWSLAGGTENMPGGAYDAAELEDCKRDTETAEAAAKAVKHVLSLLGMVTDVENSVA